MDTQDQNLEQECSLQDELKATNPWSSRHPINVRVSIPLLKQRYYLTIIGGKERRNPERIQKDKLEHPLTKKGNIVFFICLGTITGLAIWALLQALSVLVLKNLGALI
jgi:hypothetical protein